jgi:hypothetical protein
MNIPDRVKKLLRAEVGFGCPVENCGSPYLTYHHFDPPRRVREHNEPAGMVALCRKHHDDAEGGAFTTEQLRAMKIEGASRNERIKGQFLWRRQQLLIHCGAALTFEAPIALAFNGIPVVSLTRDETNNLSLSVNMVTTSILPRLRLFENDWVSTGNPTDLEAPPYGRKLRARYPNGDEIRIEFKTVHDPDELATAVPGVAGVRDWAADLARDSPDSQQLTFPVALADIALELPDVGLSVSSSGISTPMFQMGATLGTYGMCAVSLGHIPAPYPTMINAVGITPDPPNLRFASMNDNRLWNVADRTFRRSVFLLDGFEFDNCDFDECAFAIRGQPFMLSGNKLGSMTLIELTEIQNSYNIIKFMAENGIPTFLQAAEKLGQVAANRQNARN